MRLTYSFVDVVTKDSEAKETWATSFFGVFCFKTKIGVRLFWIWTVTGVTDLSSKVELNFSCQHTPKLWGRRPDYELCYYGKASRALCCLNWFCRWWRSWRRLITRFGHCRACRALWTLSWGTTLVSISILTLGWGGSSKSLKVVSNLPEVSLYRQPGTAKRHLGLFLIGQVWSSDFQYLSEVWIYQPQDSQGRACK